MREFACEHKIYIMHIYKYIYLSTCCWSSDSLNTFPTQIQYAGQYRDDLRHGLGCLAAPRAQVFFAGTWTDGVRIGRGIAGYITNEGAAVPVAAVICRENRVRSTRRFVWKKDGEDMALLTAVAAEVQLAIGAADHAETRRRARQEGDGSGVISVDGSFREMDTIEEEA